MTRYYDPQTSNSDSSFSTRQRITQDVPETAETLKAKEPIAS